MVEPGPLAKLFSGPLARASVATTFLLALRVLTQAATLLLLVRLFPPEAYGRLASASVFAVVLGLIPSLGSGFVMMSRAGRPASASAEVWRYAWPMMLVFAALLMAVYLPAAWWLGGASPLPLRVLTWLGLGELLFSPFTGLLSFALQAHGRVPLSQTVQWVPLALRLVAAAPCFAVAPAQRLELFAILQCAAAALGCVGAFIICRQRVALDWRPRLPTREELTQGANYAGMHLVASNASEFDKVIAVRAVGAADAGLYSAASRLVVALVMPVLAMLLSAQPRLFVHAREPTASGHRLIRLIFVLAAGWGLAGAALLALSAPLLPWLFGPRFAAAGAVLPLLALVAPFLSLRFAAGTVLIALGHPLQRLLFELTGIAVLAIGMLVFARLWQLPGVVVAVILAETIMAGFGWTAVRKISSRAHCLKDDRWVSKHTH